MQRGGARPGAGRKKGAATLYSEALRAEIARLVKEDAEEMIKAQVEKAKKGDTAAFKELLDRTLGKAPQAITDADGQSLVLAFDSVFQKYATSQGTEEDN